MGAFFGTIPTCSLVFTSDEDAGWSRRVRVFSWKMLFMGQAALSCSKTYHYADGVAIRIDVCRNICTEPRWLLLPCIIKAEAPLSS